MQAYSAAGAWARHSGTARWVMDLAWYWQVRAASEIIRGECTDPGTWDAAPHDMLFGLPLSVRDGGGEPHLEMTDAMIDPVQRDPRDIAMELAREALAPPPLDGLPDATMLAVASVPGKVPEEWRPVTPYAWIAWPHAAGAAIWAMEMTAGQLRDLLAARDHGASS